MTSDITKSATPLILYIEINCYFMTSNSNKSARIPILYSNTQQSHVPSIVEMTCIQICERFGVFLKSLAGDFASDVLVG